MPMSHSFYEEELENKTEKNMGTRVLTSEQIIYILENVCKPKEIDAPDYDEQNKICEKCPLFADCLYYFTGDNSEGTVLN